VGCIGDRSSGRHMHLLGGPLRLCRGAVHRSTRGGRVELAARTGPAGRVPAKTVPRIGPPNREVRRPGFVARHCLAIARTRNTATGGRRRGHRRLAVAVPGRRSHRFAAVGVAVMIANEGGGPAVRRRPGIAPEAMAENAREGPRPQAAVGRRHCREARRGGRLQNLLAGLSPTHSPTAVMVPGLRRRIEPLRCGARTS
jgi:hypothetical protein